MACSSGCKQFGGRKNTRRHRKNHRGGSTSSAPLSYVNNSYREPSGNPGSNVLISEPGLARPALQHTGGRSRKHKGGFYPSVMASFIRNATRLAPIAAVTAYRTVRNYKKTRKHRK